jgi:hypothetical protein
VTRRRTASGAAPDPRRRCLRAPRRSPWRMHGKRTYSFSVEEQATPVSEGSRMYLEREVLQFGIGSGRPFGTGPVVLPWVVLGSNKHPRGTLSAPRHNLI